jgi:hypothetical protein
MPHVFSGLSEAPVTARELMFAFDLRTNRPIVWDEHGVPVESHSIENHMPVRNPDDYAHVDPDCGYVDSIEVDAEEYGVNVGLMGYVRGHYPEMLHLVIDAVRAYRSRRDTEQPDLRLSPAGVYEVLIGVSSLWALLMYRRQDRVKNGELPAHVASLHRTLPGAVDVAELGLKAAENVGRLRGKPVVESNLDDLMRLAFVHGLKSQKVPYRCPAGSRIIGEILAAFLLPADRAVDVFAPVMDQAESPRLLADLGVEDEVFARFSAGMRALRYDQRNPRVLARLRRLLDPFTQ